MHGGPLELESHRHTSTQRAALPPRFNQTPLTYQDARGAVRQRAVGDVGVSGDPADVRRAPVHVVMVMVEDVLEGEGGVEQVAGNGVDDTLRDVKGGFIVFLPLTAFRTAGR